MNVRFFLLPIAIFLGCKRQPSLRVEVQRDVPATQLRLHITEADPVRGDYPIEMISLNAAPDGARDPGSPDIVIWAVAHVDGQPYLRPPVTLDFGSPVPGYTSSAVPPLVLGRYEIRVSSRGVSALTHFRVTERNIVE
jgi:hypothetical protein